jgi:hypothetical protein
LQSKEPKNIFCLCFNPSNEVNKSLPLSQKLLLHVGTERHQALALLAVLCMIAAESDELFAYQAVAMSVALKVVDVNQNAVHLLTRRQATVCIATLTSVNKRLNASLN